MILSTFGAGWMIDRWGWRMVFLAFAPVGLAALALYSRIRIPADQPVTPSPTSATVPLASSPGHGGAPAGGG